MNLTRLAAKFRLRTTTTTTLTAVASSLLGKSTAFLSLKLSQLSLSTFRNFKAFVVRTVSVFAMDDLFDDDFFLGSASSSRTATTTSFFESGGGNEDEEREGAEKVYFVPFRLLNEMLSDADLVGGVLYSTSSNDDSDQEILLNLRKEEDPSKTGGPDGSFSGPVYALVPEALWLRALKRRYDSIAAVEDVNSFVSTHDCTHDVFTLQIRLSFSRETNYLIARISRKDNAVKPYKKACGIFESSNELLHIWDFSGNTTEYLMNVRTNMPNGFSREPENEIFLQLQVHGFLNFGKHDDKKNNDSAEGWTKMGCFDNGDLTLMNGSTNYERLHLNLATRAQIHYGVAASIGLTGLKNLGNTCFMNSAVQCLAHTSKLVDYFLGDYKEDINLVNPLGMNGELALAFGDLIWKLWAPGAESLVPRMFKSKLSKFAPRFSGYNQHDSQEFLAFLLDGLHEDLNRVKYKPYIEVSDEDGRADDEIAEEYWKNHLTRNNSIIVDLFQGQYRSTLICPVCKKMSITFDPFMYLTLPLPSTTMRTMTITVLNTDGVALPYLATVTVPKCGRLKDLTDALTTACSVKSNETLLVAEVYRNSIFRLLDEPSDSLALIRDYDQLVAYRLLEDSDGPLVVFTHSREEKDDYSLNGTSRKAFGIPFITRLTSTCDGFGLHEEYLRLLKPFRRTDSEGDEYNAGNAVKEDLETQDDGIYPAVSDNNSEMHHENGTDMLSVSHFRLYLTDDRASYEGPDIMMEEMSTALKSSGRLNVLVYWPDKMIKYYDMSLLNSLPEVCEPQLFARAPPESVSLYRCLEAFLKEEPLGPEDMWYCPSCEKHRQASKKLDLWRLPEILVIHLKRFSYTRFFKDKLETYVDYPVDDLDLSTYIAYKGTQSSCRYTLYAISNHYGGMGGGHYTAFIHHGHCRWYEFDDERVFPVDQSRIKTSAAYVLFYRRVPDL